MDIESYISSGVLEAYVLGTASEKEQREVQCLSSIHEEIAAELDAIRFTMEQYGQANAIAPPADLKSKIMASLDDAKIVQMNPEAQEQKVSEPATRSEAASRGMVFKMAAAIAVLIAAGFMAMYLQTRSEMDGMRMELAAITESRSDMQFEIERLNNELQLNRQMMAFLQDTATVGVHMKGLPAKAPEGLATVFWNKASSEAYLNVRFLPEPPTGKQYQLWAIVDGKPSDMGVFEIASSGLQKVPDVQGAQAFAVTLEPAGGSVNPTLEEMYVVGEV